MEQQTSHEQKIAELRASFAQAGERWLINASIQPEEEANTREAREQQLRDSYGDHEELRFDYDHVVAGWGKVYNGREFSEKFAAIKGGEHMAVYAKPKPTQA